MDNGFDTGWVWAIGLLCFAIGATLGASLSPLLRGSRKRVHQLEEQIAALERQHQDYRSEVTRHFRTTSELVQKMTDSYREVYEHLASGSQALCHTRLSANSLEFTRQPTLGSDEPAATARVSGAAEATAEPLQEESDSETCMGDAPCVPHLDIEEQPAAGAVSSRTQ